MDFGSSSSASPMSTSNSLAPGDRTISVKSSIAGIGFGEQYIELLEYYVNLVHTTTTHAYSFSKYMFLRAIEENLTFNTNNFINKEFFSEVWLLLEEYRAGRVGAATAERREFIGIYVQDYLRIAHYNRLSLIYAQQTALIEGTKMYTAYTNNIHLNFGNHFRRTVNILLNVQGRKEALIARRQRQGFPQDAIFEEVRNEITLPATRFKIAIANFNERFERFIEMFPSEIYQVALETLRTVFEAYPENYSFSRNSVYYDAKSRPVEHMSALYEFACVFEELEIDVLIVSLFVELGYLLMLQLIAKFFAKIFWVCVGQKFTIRWNIGAVLLI